MKFLAHVVCVVFTWRESEKKCYFRGNGFSMSKIDDVRGVISGPRQFCDEGGDLRQLAEEDQTKGCVHAVNQDSKAETIGDPKTVDDMASCMRHCQGQKDCTHFVYSGTSKLCTLKKGRMELEEREDAVTGPRSCDASCFASGVEYGEGGLLDVSTMSTTVPADCQALCAAEPRCRAFTWKTQTKSCEFYGQGFSKNKKVGVAGAVSGPQEFCDKGGDLYRTEEQDAAGLLEDAVVDELPNATYPSSVHACIHPGIGSAAPDIAEPRKVEDFDSCAKSCRDTQGCVHYTFNEETFLCALKSGRPVFTTSSREQTGSRSCDTSCFVLQVDYWGAPDVLPSLKTTAATDCQAACAADAACKAFVWREGPSECFFKGSGFSQHKSIGAKGTVAGPAVFCDLGGNLREAEDADGHARGDSHESEGETN
ncbi:microneme protein mic4 [Cystoisospora suis]|uniref:Microneme protein mic4 n=1 Tax=Cystoisospora suis TaxID=483139 RepID=A0A2C6LDQ6_9APIC|nr:microneme protein mic4 [Cystoisospora suis]